MATAATQTANNQIRELQKQYSLQKVQQRARLGSDR